MARKFKTPITIDELGSASSQALAANVDGDSQNRINIDAGGKITWGSGSATGDTTLYRSAADTLKTDDAFTATSLAVTGQFTLPTSDGSADQIITTNGSGTLTWSDVSANATVSDTAPSSPATGQIWYESDTGKTFVYYDSFWVEVGASPPAAPFITDLDEDTKIQVEESADEDKIRFDTAGSERMIIDNTGNVGIGTTTPGAQLQITNTGSGQLYATGDGFYIDQSASQLDTLFLRSQGPVDISSDFDGGTTNDYIRFLTDNSTERMRITQDGNVGIGATSPDTLLQINNGIVTSRSTTGGQTSVQTDKGIAITAASMNASSKYTPGLLFGSTDTAFTTNNPKYNAGIFGVAAETYGADTDTAMQIEFLTAGTNGGTGHGVGLGTGFRMAPTSFYPLVDGGADLGGSSTSNRFDDVYATSGTVNTSDERDKTNITDLDFGLTFVDSLRPVSYTWADRNGYIGTRTHMGFVAQEVATALGDEAVNRGLWINSPSVPIDPEDPEGEQTDERQGLRYHQLIAPMVKAIQELSAMNAAQQTTIEALEGRIAVLEAE